MTRSESSGAHDAVRQERLELAAPPDAEGAEGTEGAAPIDAIHTVGERREALLVLGHGAGAGMEHPHLERLACRLAERGVATLRYQFPYMQRGDRRPDRPPALEATVRAAVHGASELAADTPLFAGGRSMGARMTLRAAAQEPLPGVAGLVLFAFPLHRALRVRDDDPQRLERAVHLSRADLPMLLLQGTRDALARPHLLEAALGDTDPQRCRVHWIEGADHSFRTLKSLGRSLEEVETELADRVAPWARSVPEEAPPY